VLIFDDADGLEIINQCRHCLRLAPTACIVPVRPAFNTARPVAPQPRSKPRWAHRAKRAYEGLALNTAATGRLIRGRVAKNDIRVVAVLAGSMFDILDLSTRPKGAVISAV